MFRIYIFLLIFFHKTAHRCHQDDNYVYSGEHCDIKTEKLGLEKNYIIAIAVGSGGIVILIFLIIITVLLWKRKKENTKE